MMKVHRMNALDLPIPTTEQIVAARDHALNYRAPLLRRSFTTSGLIISEYTDRRFIGFDAAGKIINDTFI